MSLSSTEPEYIVQESAKILLTEKQLDNFAQVLKDLEVDSAVLYREFTKLEGFSGRIAADIRELALLVSDMELQD